MCFVKNMVFSTPSVRAATWAETALVVAALSAAYRFAARMIPDASAVGRAALTVPSAKRADTTPLFRGRPRAVSRLANSALPRARRVATVPWGQPSSHVASLMVLP